MILSYTRASAGGIMLNPSEFNPSELIRRVCREQGGQEPTRLFHLDIRDLPEIIVGDPILLEQAFVIVVSNAMKYSRPERPDRRHSPQGRRHDQDHRQGSRHRHP